MTRPHQTSKTSSQLDPSKRNPSKPITYWVTVHCYIARAPFWETPIFYQHIYKYYIYINPSSAWCPFLWHCVHLDLSNVQRPSFGRLDAHERCETRHVKQVRLLPRATHAAWRRWAVTNNCVIHNIIVTIIIGNTIYIVRFEGGPLTIYIYICGLCGLIDLQY